MAKAYQLKIPAHPSIYTDSASERELDVFFCSPEEGVNEETGILLLTSGFGENSGSPLFERARPEFADRYNLVTVQCGYFGSQFMGGSNNPQFTLNIQAMQGVFSESEWTDIMVDGTANLQMLLKHGSHYPIRMEGLEKLEENLNDFNDMGMMQALDNLTAYLAVIDVLEDNGFRFHTGRMLTYGQSHGAYLNHLSNALAPKLFTAQIDHNSWLLPAYLIHPRALGSQSGQMQLQILFDYYVRNLTQDTELLSLPSLYRRFMNECHLICLEDSKTGTPDEKAKRTFAESVKYAMYIETNGLSDSADRIDNEYFKLFDYVMSNLKLDAGRERGFSLPNVQIDTSTYRYEVLYSTGMPVLNRIRKGK